MRFQCDCCGEHFDVPQWGATDGASVSNSGVPPDGFRTIYTIIEEHDGQGGTSSQASEILHSCADCNANMGIDEHLEAEFEHRKNSMWQPEAAGPPLPPIHEPAPAPDFSEVGEKCLRDPLCLLDPGHDGKCEVPF